MCRRRSEIIIVFIFLYFPWKDTNKLQISLPGIELVRKKVKHIYLMGGVFGKAVEPDYNFKQGTEFATNFFILWPDDVPMTFSPGEVGDPVEYVPEQVISDISWTDIHPIKSAPRSAHSAAGR